MSKPVTVQRKRKHYYLHEANVVFYFFSRSSKGALTKLPKGYRMVKPKNKGQLPYLKKRSSK